MNVPLIVVACIAATVFHVQALGADRAQAINPSDVGTVRVSPGDRGARAGAASGLFRDELSVSPIREVRSWNTAAPRVDRCPDRRSAPGGPIHALQQVQGNRGSRRSHRRGVRGPLRAWRRALQSLGQHAGLRQQHERVRLRGTFAATGRLEMFGAIKTLGPGGLPYTIESIATFVGGRVDPLSAARKAADIRAPFIERVILLAMPRGPRGQRRPADAIGNAVHIMRIATGEIEDAKADPKKEHMRRGGSA